MSVEEEVIRIKKKLSQASKDDTMNRDQALILLRTLKRMPMNIDLLAKTRIGLTVNNFRKSSQDSDVKYLARNVLKDWRKLVPADFSENCISSRHNEATEIARRKCRVLLENTLVLYGTVLKDCTDPRKLAQELEHTIYQELEDSFESKTDSCQKCLHRKTEKKHRKEMELKEQELSSAELNSETSQNLEPLQNLQHQQILKDEKLEFPTPTKNMGILLQRLKQLGVSEDKWDSQC